MEMHAVPQNIMQVEFQLFGSLTIREFSVIAAGALIAFAFYSMGFPDLIRWPVVLMLTGGGILIAKYKINDRNLEGYIFSFFNAMLSPQKMVWHKSKKSFGLLTERDTAIAQTTSTRYVKYSAPVLGDTLNINTEKEVLDVSGQAINKLFDEIYKEKVVPVTNAGNSLLAENEVKKETEPVNTTNVENLPNSTDTLDSNYEIHYEANVKNLGLVADNLLGENDDIVQKRLDAEQNKLTKKYESTHKEVKPKKDIDLDVLNNNVFRGNNAVASIKSTTGEDRAKKANIINGFVKTKNDKLLEGAVIIIKDQESGRTVRSMITNPLGYFMHTSSLRNGKYMINIYKDGCNFEPVAIELKGQILEPINIKE